MLTISETTKKADLIGYFRQKGREFAEEATRAVGADKKRRASFVNRAFGESYEKILQSTIQTSKVKDWKMSDKLATILLINHCYYSAMIDARNNIWPYEYMDFSRRVGELWDPFCKLCWTHCPNEKTSLYIPPLFTDVRQSMRTEIEIFIGKLPIGQSERTQLLEYYNKVWTLILDDINLESDLHFANNKNRFVVDFKSGFGSNEKGNMNRLMIVASAYKIIGNEYECHLLVRGADNNAYLDVLRRSGLWQVHCSEDAYKFISKYTSFDLKKWITENIVWSEDISQETFDHLKQNNLLRFLEW